MDYIQHTAADQAELLKAVGLGSVQELFAPIPDAIRLKRPLNLPKAMGEMELLAHMQQLAAKNVTPETHTSFLGGGGYTHFIPAVVDALQSRSEFVTAYTPYQAECSQGTLQHIFEYQ